MFANAKVFEFDKAPVAAKDISLYSTRDYGFVLNVIKEGNESCLVAHNRRDLPVSVFINISAEENISSDRTFPLYHVVPPDSDLCIARIYPLDKKKDYRWRYEQKWMIGDYTARHRAPDGYRVPWAKGQSYNVTQAPDGPLTTHLEPFSHNAVDFNMPEGTPVHAVRSGVVVGIVDSFKAGRLDRALLDKANYVNILQDDGTVADYAHLKENSIVVSIGQRVSTGDKLGLSGSTGYSSGPHLHFSVWTLEITEKGYERISIPVEFCFDSSQPCGVAKFMTALSHEGLKLLYDNADSSGTRDTGIAHPIALHTANTDFLGEIDLVDIKGGCFQKTVSVSNGKPVNKNTCVKDFSIGKFEITQRQWQQVMGNNPSFFNKCGLECPVENVSWNDVQEYINKLNTQTGKNYRLPSEDEWEYAARSKGKNEHFPGSTNVNSVAWYRGNSDKRTKFVGQKQPNWINVYDMSGNVMEWVADWWTEKKQPSGNRQGVSQNPPAASFRVMRGGSWRSSQEDVQINFQGLVAEPSKHSSEIGFRLAQ